MAKYHTASQAGRSTAKDGTASKARIDVDAVAADARRKVSAR